MTALLASIAGVSLIVGGIGIGIGIGIAAAAGLIFASYPARRAGGLDPIEALRME